MLFSGFCILGTYFGLHINDAIANTRAIGAVMGGLFGGPVVGFAVRSSFSSSSPSVIHFPPFLESHTFL